MPRSSRFSATLAVLGLSCSCAILLACSAPHEVGPSAPEPAPQSPTATTTTSDSMLLPALITYLDALGPELDALPAERRELLAELANFVRERRAAGQPARLVFICTHNSRRSHMGQLWAAAAAAYHHVEGVETYSGGTEATAFNPRAVAAMRRAGFEIQAPAETGQNPRYEVRLSAEGPARVAFSKTWEDPSNPSEDFAAVMTCAQADAACPFVRGAALRVSLTYEDPKQADDSPEEAQRYDERARQIATEMLYLFRLVARG